MTRVLYAVLALLASSSLAQARDLQSCAATAETKKLTGYALGTFMTECLSSPAGSPGEKPSNASAPPLQGSLPAPKRPAMPDRAAKSAATSAAQQANAATSRASAVKATGPQSPEDLQAAPVKPVDEGEAYRIAQDQRDDRLERAGRRATQGICSGCMGDGRQRSSAMPAAPRPDAAPSFE